MFFDDPPRPSLSRFLLPRHGAPLPHRLPTVCCPHCFSHAHFVPLLASEKGFFSGSRCSIVCRRLALVVRWRKNPKDADDTNFAEESYYLEKKIQVLQHRLMMKDEQISGCRQAEESLHKRVRDLDRCFKDCEAFVNSWAAPLTSACLLSSL